MPYSVPTRRRISRWIAGAFVTTQLMFVPQTFGQQTTATPAALPLSRVTLVDNTNLTGQVTYDPSSRTITVAAVTNDGRQKVDYITEAWVRTIEASTINDTVKAPTAPITQMKPPLLSRVWLTSGATMEGAWQADAPAGYVHMIPQGAAQAVAIPVATIARLSLEESPPAATPQAATGQTPQASAVAQTQQGPFVGKVVLQDDTSLTGQVNYDANTHTVVVTTRSPEGRRTVNYLAAQFVKQIERAAADSQGQQPASTELQPPLATVMWLNNGMILKGTWQVGAPPGQFWLLQDGTSHPIAIPLVAIVRLSLTENGDTSPTTVAQPVQPPQEAKTPASTEQQTSAIKASQYTAIPMGPTPTQQAAIPPNGSKVIVKTNLGQQFTGVVEFTEEKWVGLRTSMLGSMPLSPPQISVINRDNIVSIKVQENPTVIQN